MKLLKFKPENFIRDNQHGDAVIIIAKLDAQTAQQLFDAWYEENIEKAPIMYGPGKYCDYQDKGFEWESWVSRDDIPHGYNNTHTARLVDVKEI